MGALGFPMIKFPEMRKELIDSLTGLSDKQYQEDCWVKKQCPLGIENDELDYAVHFLFDDTQLSESPESMIGFCLRNKLEAKAVNLVCREISNIFDKYGYDKSDKEYIDYPEWQGVIESAKSALSALSE